MSRIYLSPPEIGEDERRLVGEAMDSGWIAPVGPAIEAFEGDVAAATGRTHACALTSGTAALHLALIVLGVERGDRVLLSDLTFAATANAVMYVGANPVFVDSDRDTWNMDPNILESELRRSSRAGNLPKAVIAVDLYGQCANYHHIVALCAQYGVPLIEDAAESLGAKYEGRPAGSFGDLSVLSFNGNKIITTSGGGALVGDNPKWIEEARFLATQARDPAPHYEHSRVGFNYRLSNILAALGRGQIADLQRRVDCRRNNNRLYRAALEGLPGVDFMPEARDCRSTFWLTAMLIDPKCSGTSSSDLRVRLEDQDIEARPVWKPMSLQPCFRGAPCLGGGVSKFLFETGLCLPSGSNLTDSERALIVAHVKAGIRDAGCS